MITGKEYSTLKGVPLLRVRTSGIEHMHTPGSSCCLEGFSRSSRESSGGVLGRRVRRTEGRGLCVRQALGKGI